MLRKTLFVVLIAVVLASCNTQATLPTSAAQEQAAGQAQPVAMVANAAAPAAASTQVPVIPTSTNTTVPALAQVPGADRQPTSTPLIPTATNAPIVEPTATAVPAASQPQPAQAVGPDTFPEGVSPLTGLPVANKANLALSPALVSITNFPVTARPQAGLSFSPFVYELYIGEGMTRFLAMFYGDYPVKGVTANTGIALSDDRIGPIRSGRMPFESLRKLYHGFLIMASASSNVLPTLNSYTNVFGSDSGDINSALIPATRLGEIASKNPDRVKAGALSGLRFDPQAPAGGKTANMLWIPFSYLNQVIWRYDARSGAYLRYQDEADATTFKQATDRLNGEPLTYENVVVLFANHTAKKETLINIDLEYVNKMPALLFRDGKMYKIFWTTANADYEKKTGLFRPIRFVDGQGNPFSLKPGQTWVELVQAYTPYNETVDSPNYAKMKTSQTPGSGNWVIHFSPPISQK